MATFGRVTRFVRKPLGVGLGVVLCWTALPGAASGSAAPADRTVTRAYTGAGGLTVSDYPGVFVQDASPAGQDTGESVGGAVFYPEPGLGERWFRIEAEDLSGRPVAVRVFWVLPRAEEVGAPKTFCDGSSPPLRIHSRGFIQTFLLAGPCGSSVSTPTRGRISATFGSTKS